MQPRQPHSSTVSSLLTVHTAILHVVSECVHEDTVKRNLRLSNHAQPVRIMDRVPYKMDARDWNGTLISVGEASRLLFCSKEQTKGLWPEGGGGGGGGLPILGGPLSGGSLSGDHTFVVSLMGRFKGGL